MLAFQHRGVRVYDRRGAAVLIPWAPRGRDLLWHLNEQCLCRVGTLDRIVLERRSVLLHCNGCARVLRYAGMDIVEGAKRQVS